MDVKIIGCGLTGAVIGRTLADCGHTVQITERRDHIGGNLYDYVDEHGVLVQQYVYLTLFFKHSLPTPLPCRIISP